MNNLSVRLKLLLCLTPLLLLVVLLTLTSSLSLGALTFRAERLVSVNYILDNLNTMRASQLAYALNSDPTELETLQKAHWDLHELLDENLATMPSPQAQSILVSIRRIMKDYLHALQHSLEKDSQLLTGPAGKLLNHEILKAIAQVNELIKLQNERRAAEIESHWQLMITVSCATLLMGCLVIWLLIRHICSPLQETLAMAKRIGECNFADGAQAGRQDEFGQLMRALAHAAKENCEQCPVKPNN
ncbi:hypothetical protein [Pseudomonas sp. UFMG81]|uniref:hypothetical protein n=1 Tax=Pseudomonas sp. UFMG81 TaxID=2745936 RepID=UPI00188E4B9B|nr:hypothetical protein [Pseudomonas sp. UFMG81]